MEHTCCTCKYKSYEEHEEPCIRCDEDGFDGWEKEVSGPVYEEITCITCLHQDSHYCSLCHKNYLWTSRTTGKARPFSTPLIESISRVVAAATKKIGIWKWW